jgi:hypothetical protein
MNVITEYIYERTNHKCILLQFGSSRLQGDIDSSDLDYVCLTSEYTREYLYNYITEILRPLCKNIIVIRQSFVPVIKFQYQNKDYDIIIACVQSTNMSLQQMMTSPSLLPEDLRSLQAVYTTEYILNYVSSKHLEFSQLLRNIKNWCIQQGIYSNPLGLLNGVTLAIMCAWIIRNYSNCNYFHKFFEVYSTWNWENDPVTIYPYLHKNIKRNCMNVYTPFEKPLNTMFNTTKQQYQIIMKRLNNYEKMYNFFESIESVYMSLQLVSRNISTHVEDRLYIESKLKLVCTLFPEDQIQEIEFCTTCYEISPGRTIFYIKFKNKPSESELLYIHEQFIMKLVIDSQKFVIIPYLTNYSKLPSFLFNSS